MHNYYSLCGSWLLAFQFIIQTWIHYWRSELRKDMDNKNTMFSGFHTFYKVEIIFQGFAARCSENALPWLSAAFVINRALIPQWKNLGHECVSQVSLSAEYLENKAFVTPVPYQCSQLTSVATHRLVYFQHCQLLSFIL